MDTQAVTNGDCVITDDPYYPQHTPIATLPQGHPVTILYEWDGNWKYVETLHPQTGEPLRSFVEGKYLAAAAAEQTPEPVPAQSPAAAETPTAQPQQDNASGRTVVLPGQFAAVPGVATVSVRKFTPNVDSYQYLETLEDIGKTSPAGNTQKDYLLVELAYLNESLLPQMITQSITDVHLVYRDVYRFEVVQSLYPRPADGAETAQESPVDPLVETYPVFVFEAPLIVHGAEGSLVLNLMFDSQAYSFILR